MGIKEKSLVLTKFVEGKVKFLSTGMVTLKITNRIPDPEKDGDVEEVSYISLPIKSIGMIEFQEQLEKEAPVPPTKLTTVKEGSELNTDMGLAVGSITKVFDVTDEDYRKEFSEYHSDFNWRMAISALDMEWEDKEGSPIIEFKRKKEILEASGITGHHLDIIIEGVARLTSERERMADFLSRKK